MMLSEPFFWGALKSMPNIAARWMYSAGSSSKMAAMPGSPFASPSARNCMPTVDLPEPEGPAMSRLSPSGMPPFISASSLAIPVERRRLPLTCVEVPLRPNVRGNVWRPESVMRKVCSPGTEPWPRSFMICILRTMELRSTVW